MPFLFTYASSLFAGDLIGALHLHSNHICKPSNGTEGLFVFSEFLLIVLLACLHGASETLTAVNLHKLVT